MDEPPFNVPTYLPTFCDYLYDNERVACQSEDERSKSVMEQVSGESRLVSNPVSCDSLVDKEGGESADEPTEEDFIHGSINSINSMTVLLFGEKISFLPFWAKNGPKMAILAQKQPF